MRATTESYDHGPEEPLPGTVAGRFAPRGARRTNGRIAPRATAILLSLATLGGTPSTAPAATGVRRPWLVAVEHRIDLERIANSTRAEEPDVNVGVARSAIRVRNVTAGFLIDGQGHVVTRLVNLDPTAPTENIAVSAGDERTSARLVGVDGPSGFAVLDAPTLRGRPSAPVLPAAPVAVGTDVRILSADFSAPMTTRAGVVALLPPIAGRVVSVSSAQVLARSGVLCTIESRAFFRANDFSLVEAADGRVVGVAKFVADGRGQVYPITFVRDVAERVVKTKGSVESGWLGADGRAVTSLPVAERIPSVESGFVIDSLASDGPAQKGGLLTGDVIMRLDDMAVRDGADLASYVAATPSGSVVTLTVLRGGATRNLLVTLGGRKPGATRKRVPDSDSSSLPSGPGLLLQDLGDQLASFFGVTGGALVSGVVAGSPAERIGLLAGDVIVAVGGAPVTNRTEVANRLFEATVAGNTTITLRIFRKGQELTRDLPLTREPRKP